MIRVLIEHGDKIYEGYNNVADLVHQRVDPELFDAAAARQLFDSYFGYIQKHHTLPQLSYFINHPEQQIQERMATLLHTRNEISPNWSNNYGIETLNGELNYINEADSALSYFELKKIMKMQEELAMRFLKETDIHKITVLQQKVIELKKAENEIIRRHGTVVLKISGKR